MQVELVSPEGILYSGEADMVICRTVGAGDIAFMAGHVPFIGSLAIYPVKVVTPEGATQLIAVHRGFVEVAHDKVTILSDVAELPEHIDTDRARQALDRANAELRAAPDSAEAAAALRRAEVRLEVAGAPAGARGGH
ncbi:MAG: ATP synthase F1 subunit epsilon [Acidimicrobiales bacterium]